MVQARLQVQQVFMLLQVLEPMVMFLNLTVVENPLGLLNQPFPLVQHLNLVVLLLVVLQCQFILAMEHLLP